MNVPNVVRTTAGLAAWLVGQGHRGGTVVVGRDARTGSAEFFTATTEVLTAAGFDVVALPRPLPTPVTAYAVRELNAVAGVQITASHNPASDNGYKVYLSGGAQIVEPADRQIEAAIDDAPDADSVPRTAVVTSRGDLVDRYLARVASLPRSPHRDLTIALTPLHGVGGETAVAALHAAGFTDVHVVATQFEPDPAFPTVAFPNPEEPGASTPCSNSLPTSTPTSRSRWIRTPIAARSRFPARRDGGCFAVTKPACCSATGSSRTHRPGPWWRRLSSPRPCSAHWPPRASPIRADPHRLQVARPSRRGSRLRVRGGNRALCRPRCRT